MCNRRQVEQLRNFEPTQLQKHFHCHGPYSSPKEGHLARATAARQSWQWSICGKCHLAAGGFDARSRWKTWLSKKWRFPIDWGTPKSAIDRLDFPQKTIQLLGYQMIELIVGYQMSILRLLLGSHFAISSVKSLIDYRSNEMKRWQD